VQVTRRRYEVEGWGDGELWLAGRVVVAHDFPLPPGAFAAGGATTASTTSRTPPKGAPGPPRGTLSGELARVCDDFVSDLVRRVRAHVGGARVTFGDVELDLAWCTAFQAELARALRAVPWGEVVSYGELATLAGRRGAARAAGSFCASNRHALFLPCHRVVSADGIGGYGTAGVELKRRLLRVEGVSL
jgi:methylated-DNA-[protein]-cysteine S-methyltransferase